MRALKKKNSSSIASPLIYYHCGTEKEKCYAVSFVFILGAIRTTVFSHRKSKDITEGTKILLIESTLGIWQRNTSLYPLIEALSRHQKR